MGQTLSHLLPIRSKKPRNNSSRSLRSQELLSVGTEVSTFNDDTSISNKVIEEATSDEQVTTSWVGETLKAYLWEPGHMEKQRVQEQYQTIKMLFNDRYHFGPTQQLTIKGAKILDVGCGDVSWAMDMAEEFPEAEIHIVDIGGLYPASGLPNNIQVHAYDVDDALPFPDNHFDYVHQALMCLHIKEDNWPQVINECVRVAKKDAVIELIEVDIYVNAPGPITDTIFIAFSFVLRSRGIMPSIARKLKQLLEESNVRDVLYEVVNAPLGDHGGPAGTRWKTNHHILVEGGTPFFGKLLNLDVNEMREREAQVLREFEEYHSYQNIFVFYGFKR
ncbi:S-adenosyl-L-methionine-dependent methyltransferase [Endogone sp. FLAS-F59071]|nr:S-adenosyl-L-methionine-dependent methyltransferase [Endogone sp. FLAS-F59071]|eukprot:RUS13500.1 S-adenosyl-L-methionine-dependent methyltransferase [Endogone sp. FLAS-F59071]